MLRTSRRDQIARVRGAVRVRSRAVMASSSTQFLPRIIALLGCCAVLGPSSVALAQAAPAVPPDPWFSQPPTPAPVPQPGADAQAEPAPADGAFVQLPPPPPPPPPPPDIDYGGDSYEDGTLLMGMLAVRPFATSVGQGPSPDDPESIVAGHVGLRMHGTGIDDDIIGRGDLEGFIGASSEGVEGEGRAFLGLGLATEVGHLHHLMFRFGAGGALLGNPVIDYQVADLPALELGYIHTGDEVLVEVAPRIAMGILQMSAFDSGSLEPDPAPAIGGRILAGGSSLWAMVDYEVVTGDQTFQLGGLTACYANKLALCIDGRVASASLDFGGGTFDRVTAISGGLSIGLGDIEMED